MPTAKTKTIYPVTLYEAKLHLRVDDDFTNDDGYIEGLIKAATQQAENYIGNDIAYTSNVTSYYDWSGDTVRVDEGNLIDVQYVISDTSVAQTISAIKSYYNYFEVLLSESVSSTTDYTPLKIEYTTGYDENECPEVIKQAILVKIANMYDVDREDATPKFLNTNTSASNMMLDAYKHIDFT